MKESFLSNLVCSFISRRSYDDFKNENAKYIVYAGYVSYPHYPWRNYSYSNFKLNIPKELAGEYIITVSDVSDNGVMPQQYKLIVK